jgi:hypothetical protein
LNLTRDYGRALPGERIVEGVPSVDGSNYTLPGVLGLNGFDAAWLLEGALNFENRSRSPVTAGLVIVCRIEFSRFKNFQILFQRFLKDNSTPSKDLAKRFW